MAVDGNWNITMTTPMGERKATLAVKSAGSTLTGTQGADGNTVKSSTAPSTATMSPGNSRSPTRCR